MLSIRVQTIFESAVISTANKQLKKINEAYKTTLKEKVRKTKDNLVESIDKYLNVV
jgi:mRNA-degrading endonuclease RelE of RelBE toxin-antitoxin system